MITARLFARLREQAGTTTEELDLAGASVAEVYFALRHLHPALEGNLDLIRPARNESFAQWTEAVEDGDEVAFIPPVSGGADESPEGDGDRRASAKRRILELRETPFDNAILGELADRLATDEDGAVVGFLGRTRRSPGTPAPGQEAEAARHAGRAVDSLGYEAHETMALAVLGTIADEVAERFGVERLAIVHRTGDVPLGEVSIAVVAAAPHRDAAFRAARYGIDETKARAPIWKAERFMDGHVWIGEPARTAAHEEEPR